MGKLADDAFDSDPRIARILDIVAKETRIERAALQPRARLADLGIESLDLTVAVFEIETVFDIDIPVIGDQPGTEFVTVGDLVFHVIAVLDKAAGTDAGTKVAGAAG